MPSTIEQANNLGSFINNWGKIVLFLGGGVVSCAYAYYMLITHDGDIYENKRSIKEESFERKKEQEETRVLLEERCSKRHARLTEKDDRMEAYGIMLERRVNELEKEVAYLKGIEKNK